MTITITQKITGYSVVKKDADAGQQSAVQHLHETLERPDVLMGTTYKVKTPLSDHALYITINDVVLNPGTPLESRRPFEMFINSKAMEHFQWIVALTRIISAVFRKGGEISFLVGELRSVCDPKGGYFKKGGKFQPSLVAEIGDVLEQHLFDLNLIQRDTSLAEAARSMVAAKIEKARASAPEGKMLCPKCQEFGVIIMDGCAVCTSCGDSKCS